MNQPIRLIAGASLLAILSACTPADRAPPAAASPRAAAPAMTQAEAHDALFALFEAADEDELRRNPLFALLRGDTRYADLVGDYFTDAFDREARASAERNLRQLQAIPRASLSATDRIAYDVFEHNQRQALIDSSAEMLALTNVRPINHFSGFHTFYPTFASGQGAAPFKTLADYENNLKRHRQFAALMDRAIARFREGLDSGVLETRLTISNVIEQFDTQLAIPPTKSPFYGPVEKMPDSFTPAQKERLRAKYEEVITGSLYPAFTRMRNFLRDEYHPRARDSVGLSQMKGGARLYDRLIETSTTLPLSADSLHDLGLSEVARIRADMEKVKAQVGFTGTLEQFFDHLRTDQRFKPQSREWLTQRYYDIGKKVDAHIGDYFGTLPETPLEIRPYEPFREKFSAGGSYQQGTPDGSRPGIFYFNAYDLPSRTTPGMTTLYLHEGAPGHHFQISLAAENEDLPAFMRFGGNTAYVEGWALYAETLGYDMGLFDDPYQRQGTLDDEMLRAMRLVVDTGIHAKGWSRDQAIRYMMDNSSMGRTDATAEVERYIAIPGQALAYKVGALKIQALRDKAKAALGEDFDIRAFHDQVLMTGALPLPVLERKIDDWIAAGGV
ncbi:DUF885 domain-containing protein [Sphingomicrobium lutaoense]|uniref:Uncharacterized protein (DUF885 family) n=1 Tax=Sphingomicrobium lutaoense TaxID=515949 RepID=A0A839YZY7_9SPHN|nr:DUF885 domain-containing protein [Sphingomicrobium lutaoense]MBB3763012.1 uncharacterized protein (DUF885 family) [Sphingomicrobium lutaoense]